MFSLCIEPGHGAHLGQVTGDCAVTVLGLRVFKARLIRSGRNCSQHAEADDLLKPVVRGGQGARGFGGLG